MSGPSTELEDIHRLLAGVETTISGMAYCWLASRTEDGIRARPMGRILTWQSEDAWTFLFVTGLRSRKVADVRHSGHVTLIFQKENEAYVSLAGHARLIDEEGAVRALWNEKAYGHHFPTGDDRANAGFIEVKIVRMELWIRGLTPEPFGVRPTILIRASDRSWRRAD